MVIVSSQLRALALSAERERETTIMNLIVFSDVDVEVYYKKVTDYILI